MKPSSFIKGVAVGAISLLTLKIGLLWFVAIGAKYCTHRFEWHEVPTVWLYTTDTRSTGPLTSRQFLVQGFPCGSIPSYQVGAIVYVADLGVVRISAVTVDGYAVETPDGNRHTITAKSITAKD